MIKCPKCEEELEFRANLYQPEDADYLELLLDCGNEHQYFVRIKAEDLIED